MKEDKETSGWEREMENILNTTIIDGGYDYSKEDSWLGEKEARDRIKSLLLSTRAEAREATLKQFWLNEFASEDLRCCLCRNGGMLVDMNGIRRNCICPNGRSLSKKDQ